MKTPIRQRRSPDTVRLTKLVAEYKAYVALITDELKEILPMAVDQGWRSSRVEAGKAMRARIAELEAEETKP